MNRFYRRRRMVALVGSLAALPAAAPAWSQVAPPFAQLFRQTRDTPRVLALDAEVARARGLAEQARARPNPSINVYAENFAGDRTRNAADQRQTTFQIDQPIELGGKRSARIAAGEAGIVAAQARGVDGRLAYATDLARAYAGVELAERRIVLASEEAEAAGADLKVARALVGAGKEARLRQLQAETELNSLQAVVENARADRSIALARLSALAGAPSAYTGVSESLLDRLNARPPAGPLDPLQSATVRAAEAERDAAARQVTVQQRLAIPNVTAQLGVRQLRVASGPAIVAGLSVPLPLFDNNQDNIDRAIANRHAADFDIAAAKVVLRRELTRLQARMAVNATEARRINTEVVPAAERAVRLIREGMDRGGFSYVEFSDAQRTLSDARLRSIEALKAYHLYMAALNRLTGRHMNLLSRIGNR